MGRAGRKDCVHPFLILLQARFIPLIRARFCNPAFNRTIVNPTNQSLKVANDAKGCN